jgi:small subunit ribosomal protein S8
MMTDPVADMLTRIRNAVAVEKPSVDIPYSRLKQGIAGALQREGFIWDFEVVEGTPCRTLRLNLKYGPNGEQILRSVKRVSKPGRRVYCGVSELKDVLQGLGVSIVSTNRGILSNRECRKEGVGGEVLCELW